MADLDWQKVRELFDAATDRPAAERVEWLAQVCGSDEALRSEVEKLLRAHDKADEFIETPAFAKLADQPTRELAGQRVGAYQVIRELGRGGMGVVYLAERADGEFRKQVAIKLLPVSAGEQVKQRFRRERQILADLEHPNIARLLDGGTIEGQPFVVMEFVAGQSLREVLRQRGALPINEVVAIVRQVCDGLAEAHERGVIHRDIKPENLIVAERHGQPHVSILDFGIAKLQQSSNTTSQTHNALILGTPSYMSPEQAAGAGFAEIDKRADIYSLGMVIYEMLTGAPAFQGDSFMSVLYQHQHVLPTPLHELKSEVLVSRAVSEVVMKALSKKTAERQQTARQLADEFAEAVRSGKPVQKRLWRKKAVVAGAVLAIAFSIWAVVGRKNVSPAPVVLPTPQVNLATADSTTKLQYLVLKKGATEGTETALESNGAVHSGDEIQFEFTAPFTGHCYLLFEDSKGKLFWMNPQRDRPPQQMLAGKPLRVPEGVWFPYEESDRRKQIYTVVLVPAGVSWSLESVVPQSDLVKETEASRGANFPHARIKEPFATRLLKEVEEKALLANFINPPVNGLYSTEAPSADGRKVVFYKIFFWHLK
ncbi:MAG: protein kinase [Acidobacteriota bacterium]|nr:protein kinase [Acidobacteriota bacterium]